MGHDEAKVFLEKAFRHSWTAPQAGQPCCNMVFSPLCIGVDLRRLDGGYEATVSYLHGQLHAAAEAIFDRLAVLELTDKEGGSNGQD